MVDSRGFQKLFTLLILVKKAMIFEVLSAFRTSSRLSGIDKLLCTFWCSGHS